MSACLHTHLMCAGAGGPCASRALPSARLPSTVTPLCTLRNSGDEWTGDREDPEMIQLVGTVGAGGLQAGVVAGGPHPACRRVFSNWYVALCCFCFFRCLNALLFLRNREISHKNVGAQVLIFQPGGLCL